MAALPTTNITTTLVANTLGVTTRNVGELCTSSKINMWSRRKPVRDTRLVIDSYTDIGKGADGMCGLILPPWEGDDTLLTYYGQPRGHSSYFPEPYRLGDFRGYFHNNRTLPVTLLPQPDSIQINSANGTGSLPNAYTSISQGAPLVTLHDLGMRVCTFYYVHSSHFIGWSPGTYFNFGEAAEIYIDVKFGLIPTAQAASLDYWYTELPGSGINIYELPRENTTQNKNWFRVKTLLPPMLTNWNVMIRRDLNRLEYSMAGNFSSTLTIAIKEEPSGTTKYQFSVSIVANEISSGYKRLDNIPYLAPDKTYVAYVYNGQNLLASRVIQSGS